MDPVHILIGSNEDYLAFLEAVQSGESLSWIVPKSAQAGDLALILFSNAIGGVGRVEGNVEPAESAGRYACMIGSLVRVESPVPVSQLVQAFGATWKWPTYPRGYTTVPPHIAGDLLKLLGTLTPPPQNEADDTPLPPFDPDDEESGRERILRAIAERQGQGAFRADLLAAYGRKCAISGCECLEVLDAAHISPYNGRKTNDVRNGLLLRTDLHALFDRHRLTVDPTTLAVIIDPGIRGRAYRVLDGKTLSLPEQAKLQPSKEALRKHFQRCSFATGGE
jgi:hypothetical protein